MALAKLAKAQKEIALLPETIRKTNEKSLEYIQYMASRTNTDIKSWDVFDKFPGEEYTTEGGAKFRTLLADKRKIGQIFFELLEEKSKKTPPEESIIGKMPQLIEALRVRMESQLEQRKSQLKRNINSFAQRAKDYDIAASREREQSVKARVELMALEGGDSVSVVRNELDEVLREGYWINPVFEDGFLYLNTASNVVNALKNKKTNTDISVDLGQFAVKVDLNSFRMWVIPYKNNLRSSANFYHPHVSTNGRICWGDGAPQVTDWTNQLKIGSILRLLYSLLQNYSPDAPYDHIQNFKGAKKYGRIAEGLKHPDRKKKKKATPNLEQMSASNTNDNTGEIPIAG